MKQLRKYIRQILLTEGMITPNNLPEGIGVAIWTRPARDYAYIGYVLLNDKGNILQSLAPDLEEYEDLVDPETGLIPGYIHQSGIYGQINIEKMIDDEIDGTCDGAYQVRTSVASSGNGPLLYDLAIEFATTHGTGLIPHRHGVSRDAQKIWQKYINDRPDVKVFQCDDPNMAIDKGWYNSKSGSWINSPLSKRYSKNPERTHELLRLKKLVYVES